MKILFLVLFLFLFLCATPLCAQPTIEFAADGVRVLGLAPSERVRLGGVMRQAMEYYHRVAPVRTSTVANTAGVGFLSASPASLGSVVFCLREDGSLVFGTPEGKPVELSVNGAGGRVELDRSGAHLFLITADEIAYQMVSDGAPADADGQVNGRIALAPGLLFRRRGNVDGARAGERLVIIDHERAAFGTLTVGRR